MWWTISDDNNDNRQWLTSTSAPLSGANSLYINWTLGGTGPLNDWIFTPELQLTGGTSYDLQFAYKSRGSTFVESMSVWLGSAKDSASMTTMLFDSTNFAFAAYDTVMVTFTPSTTSSYYIGFFGYSQNDQFGILVDDFSLDVSTITSVSNVKNNVALTVYPNPNKGVFTLNVNTTDVKELEIKVMNLQGQVVFVKNSFDNISTINENVDLSNNAKGIYFVMVTSDKGVITHKVVVQ
ncbi:MAG: T9SS type A sorting domain-containing protein [Flavobacteriales bacterium]|nr:T9SS type A sorting domain-containing protein [Flavobacteriales bacterium]